MPEISPTTWIGAITFILAGLLKVYLEVRAGNKTTQQVKETTERVLILTDGRMTAALKNIARLSRSLANQTRDPEDVSAAELAEKELEKKYITDEEAHAGKIKNGS